MVFSNKVSLSCICVFLQISTLSSQTPENLKKHSKGFTLQFSNEVLCCCYHRSVMSSLYSNLCGVLV